MGLFDSILGAQSLPSSPTSQGTTNQSSTTTPSIQPQFQPYVTNYLNRAQDLVANQQTPALLNQSYVGAAGLQLPGGFASGTELAQAGGKGSLSTAPIALDYGQKGFQYGAEAPDPCSSSIARVVPLAPFSNRIIDGDKWTKSGGYV